MEAVDLELVGKFCSKFFLWTKISRIILKSRFFEEMRLVFFRPPVFFVPFQMASSDQIFQVDYRQRRRIYKRQYRIGIFGVGLVALCLVAAKASVSNNNSRITNAKRIRRSTGSYTHTVTYCFLLRNDDVISENPSETEGDSTAENNVNWYKEPPFNYLEPESCTDPAKSYEDEKPCYVTVENYTNLGLVPSSKTSSNKQRFWILYPRKLRTYLFF